MYYFLAIVTDENMLKGNFVPSFILCNGNRNVDKHAPWMMVRANKLVPGYPKVLVTTLTDHEDMINYVSAYRFEEPKDNIRHKMFAKGGLFWFPCDIYGIQNGPALFIKRVPDGGRAQTELAFQTLKAYQSRHISMNELLTKDSSMFDLTHSHIKPKLFQKGRRRLNAGKERSRNRAEARKRNKT